MLHSILNRVKIIINSLTKTILSKPSIEGIEVKYLDFNDLSLTDKIQYLIILYK